MVSPQLEHKDIANTLVSAQGNIRLVQLVNPPLMGVALGLLVGLTPLGTLLFPPAARTAASFSAPTPARYLPPPLSAHCCAHC